MRCGNYTIFFVLHKVHYFTYNIAGIEMDMRTLQLFLHLADTLHFGRTSRACFISPSALSRQIMRLEDELGQALFIRDNRQVGLTRAGELFRIHARRALDELEKAAEELQQENRELQGQIRLFCSVTACYGILPDIIPGFRDRHPHVRVDLRTGDAASAVPTVIAGDTDIAVAAMPDSLPDTLAFKPLTTTPLVFIAPRDSTDGSRFTSAEAVPWSTVPLIITEKEPARKRAEVWFRERGFTPVVRSYVAGNEAILAMVGLGLGIGVVPELVVEKSPVRTGVVILDASGGPGYYTVGLCTHKRSLKSPRIRSFWDEAGRD